jgi:hypothetical protein
MFHIEREINNFNQLRQACQDLVLNNDVLKKIMELFEDQVRQGLSKETHDVAEVKCYITYVQDLPTGNGEFRDSFTFYGYEKFIDDKIREYRFFFL